MTPHRCCIVAVAVLPCPPRSGGLGANEPLPTTTRS